MRENTISKPQLIMLSKVVGLREEIRRLAASGAPLRQTEVEHIAEQLAELLEELRQRELHGR